MLKPQVRKNIAFEIKLRDRPLDLYELVAYSRDTYCIYVSLNFGLTG